VRLYRTWWPASAAATSNRLRSSAITGRTTDRFCLRERTSPRTTSSSSTPTYTYLRARLLPLLVGLDDVVHLDVVVLAQGQTTFEALADLDGVILEPAQRRDLQVFRDHHVVPQQARLGVAADLARGDQAAGDGAELGRLEHLADLCPAELDFLVLGLEHALEGVLDLLDRLVDHRVVAHVHAFAGGDLGRLALGPDVEAQHDDVVGDGEVDVALGDGTDAAVDDPQLDVVADIQLHKGVFQCLDGTGVVALDDQVELVGLL